MGALMYLAVTLFLAIAGSEACAQLTVISSFIIKQAALRLPAEERDRYLEEWLAHLNDCPGPLSKLWHGIGCWISSRNLALQDISWRIYIGFIFIRFLGELMLFGARHYYVRSKRYIFISNAAQFLGLSDVSKNFSQSAQDLCRLSYLMRRTGCEWTISNKFAFGKAPFVMTNEYRDLYTMLSVTIGALYFEKVMQKVCYASAFRRAIGFRYNKGFNITGPFKELAKMGEKSRQWQREIISSVAAKKPRS